jgi:hypothetical protein
MPVTSDFNRNKLAVTNATNGAPIVSSKINSRNNVPSFGREGIKDKLKPNQIWVPKPPDCQSGAKLEAKLPSLLPFMKFTSFPKLEWPDKSYLNWFKAHGLANQIKEVSSLKEFVHFYLRSKNIPVSSSSWHSVHSSKCIAPISSPSWPAAEALQMVNILIDPRQFVPRGFQIRHVPGRNAVKKVLVARRLKAPEEFAIVSITPFPLGQVPFRECR